MNSSNVKGYLKSRTLWGILIAFIPTALRLGGVPVPAGTEDVLNAIILGGLGLGAYGRVTATQRLAFRPR